MVRVHDVAETVDFLAVREVLHGGAEVGEVDPGDDALKWIRAETSADAETPS
jgi:dihydropteroate synthase